MGSGPAQKVTVSPHPVEVGSEPAQEVTATADTEEGEEEEKENRDTHFKAKAQVASSSRFSSKEEETDR